MTATLTCKMKSYIQPFEKKLALAELTALTGGTPKPLKSAQAAIEYLTASSQPAELVAGRLAYWEHVRTSERERFLTEQILREATAKLPRVVSGPLTLSTLRLAPAEENLPNRRCLRYGPHGLHEYRGKYFPQLVRALLNISGASRKSVVVDPMSGSGTTAVEAVLSGCRALGTDMNPLSVFMGQTKCELLSISAETLVRQVARITETLEGAVRLGSGLPYLSSLPENDQAYLTAWFSPKVLRQLDRIAQEIQKVNQPVVQKFFWLSLSNILRGVSWQKNDDLRVRKEIRDDSEIDAVQEFLKELRHSTIGLVPFLQQIKAYELGAHRIKLGDARELGAAWAQYREKVDAVITSPPYATALPYLDTDRLSLAYLGLLPRAKHRGQDLRMIGNREVSEKIRREYWTRFLEHKQDLPDSVSTLIQKIDRLNQGHEIGFRRRNLPALLAKYFFDMKNVLEGIQTLLRPGATAYVVVGNNHTTAGGKGVDINTAQLLKDIADSIGLTPKGEIPMEMLVSRDIFRKNTLKSETILALQK